MKRRLYNLINRNWWQVTGALLGLVALLAVLLLCGGCICRPLAGAEPASQFKDQRLGSFLCETGERFIVWGGIAFGIGLALRFALGWLSAIPWAGDIARLGLGIGGGLIATGMAFYWLGSYLWAVVLACVCTVVAVAWYHRNDVRRWILAWKSRASKASK